MQVDSIQPGFEVRAEDRVIGVPDALEHMGAKLVVVLRRDDRFS
jgi:hypothetical protein